MAKAEDTDDEGGAAPKSKKKLFIIIAAVVLIAGGAAAWFFLGGGGKKDNAEEAHKAAEHKDPIFVTLESFTVNLQRAEGSDTDQYLQIGMALKVTDPALEGKIKTVLPEIRSKINLLLSGRQAAELVTVEGKKKLAADIAAETNLILGFGKSPNADKPKAEGSSEEAPAPPVAAGPNPDDLLAPTQVSNEVGYPDEAAAKEKEKASEEKSAEEKATEKAPEKLEGKGVLDVLFTSFIIQ